MLGIGRPFAVQLVNPRKIRHLSGDNHSKTLIQLEAKINSIAQLSMCVNGLRRITKQHADQLNAANEGLFFWINPENGLIQKN